MKNYIFAIMLIGILIFGCLGSGTQTTSETTQNSPQNGQTNTDQMPPLPPDNSPNMAPPTSEAQEISFSSERWMIYGSMYQAQQTPTKVIVLAHMYSHDRSDYPQYFIEKIQNQIPEAVIIAIDLRGHGRSTNLGRDDSLSTEQIEGMKNDVIAAKNFAKSSYPSIREAYGVGASIGSTATILASFEDRDFTKAALLSPAFGYREVNTQSAIEGFRGKLLLVSSENDDPDSRNSVPQMNLISGASNKEVKIYPEGHGSEIFGVEGSATPKLDELLVRFLKN